MSSELTNWQKVKFKSLFELLDNDGNGSFDESELEGGRDRLFVESGWPENSRVISHVTARWNVFLRALFQDSPLMAESRWLDFLSRFLNRDRELRTASESYRGPLEELGQLLFLLLDRDRNSLIDYQEFLLFYYAIGQNDSAAEECFEKLDTDQDGFLSKQEMEDLTLEFFHGTQPGSHGDWLFGPPPEPQSEGR